MVNIFEIKLTLVVFQPEMSASNKNAFLHNELMSVTSPVSQLATLPKVPINELFDAFGHCKISAVI